MFLSIADPTIQISSGVESDRVVCYAITSTSMARMYCECVYTEDRCVARLVGPIIWKRTHFFVRNSFRWRMPTNNNNITHAAQRYVCVRAKYISFICCWYFLSSDGDSSAETWYVGTILHTLSHDSRWFIYCWTKAATFFTFSALFSCFSVFFRLLAHFAIFAFWIYVKCVRLKKIWSKDLKCLCSLLNKEIIGTRNIGVDLLFAISISKRKKRNR